MTTRSCARLHAWLVTTLAALVVRLRAQPQSGQGTVEYVALVLLVAAVLAAAVAAAHGSHFKLADIVIAQLTKAINGVGGSGPK